MLRIPVLVAAGCISAQPHAQVTTEAAVLTAKAPVKSVAAMPARPLWATGPRAARMVHVSQQTGATPVGNLDLAPQIDLAEGKSSLMKLPYPVVRVSVGNPRIADVILLNSSEVYMLGKGIGTTNLMLWTASNDATVVDISVNMDTSPLEARIARLLPAEKQIKVETAADTLVLSGTVTDAVAADRVLALATAYVQRSARANQSSAQSTPGAQTGGQATQDSAAGNGGSGGQQANQPKVINMLSIGSAQQVMLEVKIAEISKSLVDQLGASIGATRTNGSWTYTLLSNLLSNNPSVLDAFNKTNGNFATLDAQKRDGLIKVLAEPTVMAISGQEASFLAGGKIFIPVSQTNNFSAPTITLEEKEFGVAVKFTPTVLDGGRINLKVAPEVSELNKEGIGITATGVTTTAILPSFTTRRSTTTVQLRDGQSFAIGGLIKNNVTANIKRFPVLGELPVLGALFRSSDFQTDRSELVFIVTPHLVKPLPDDYPLPTDSYVEPSRTEFFLGGKLEGTRKEQAPKHDPATGFEVR